MTRRFLAVCVAVLAARAASGQDLPGTERYTLRLEYGRWHPGLDGQIQKGLGDSEGTLLELTDDLGVADESTWELRGTIRLGASVKLRGAYIPLDKYQGDTVAQTNFFYGGQQFFAGEHVVTSLDGKFYRGEIQWDFQKGAGGFVGVYLGAKVFDVASVVVAPDSGKRVIEDALIPIPVLGLSGRTYQGRFSVEGDFSGMTAGSRGHVWEVSLYGRVHLSDRLAVGGGYHRVSFEGKDDRDFVSIKLRGWSYAVELSL